MAEIAYSLTGYQRIIKHYDWYVIEEIDIFNNVSWQYVDMSYSRDKIIKIFEKYVLTGKLERI